MKAAIYRAYGPPEVLQLEEYTKPSPQDHEVLVKIHATAVSSGDCRIRKAEPFAVRFFFGLFKPGKPILGGVLSGEIEAVGRNVREFKVGDQVFGSTTMDFGAYADYICLPETAALALKPAHLRHEEAASLPFGAQTALHYLQKVNLRPGQEVLIYGASGAVGSAAVQLAKYFGATVTGVCSTANVELVKSLGADHVIDYTQSDFKIEPGRYDVVYETVNKAAFSSCLAAVKKNGTLILGAADMSGMLRGGWATLTSRKKVIAGVALPTAAGIKILQKLAMEGRLKAVIDRQYPLEQIAAAHAYVETGRKKGNVVILV